MSIASSRHSSQDIHAALREMVGTDVLTVTVNGECMMPWIKTGSRVQITLASFYWPGDVVVVLAPDGQYLAHRMIGLYWRSSQWHWLTQADAALRPDAAVATDAVLGRLCGGDCHPQVISIPLTHRFRALRSFVRVLVSALKKRMPLWARYMGSRS